MKSSLPRFAERPFEGSGNFSSAEPEIALQLIRVAVFLFELENGRQGIIVTRVESGGAEFYFFDEGDVEDAGGTACAALCGKVVDNGYFDAIEVIDIFVGRSAADDDVVAEAAYAAGCAANAGKGLYYTADVEVAAGVAAYFFVGEALHRERGFERGGAGCFSGSLYRYTTEVHRLRLKFKIEC
jgi:hypothetical protein